jgi:hypothetical protein
MAASGGEAGDACEEEQSGRGFRDSETLTLRERRVGVAPWG